MSTDGLRTKWCRNIAEHFNRLTTAHECYRWHTRDRRRTATAYSERGREFTFAKNELHCENFNLFLFSGQEKAYTLQACFFLRAPMHGILTRQFYRVVFPLWALLVNFAKLLHPEVIFAVVFLFSAILTKLLYWENGKFIAVNQTLPKRT